MSKNNKKINITYQKLQTGEMVTGSSGLISIKVNNKETKILIDCGAIQEGKYSPKQLFDMNRMDRDMSDIKHVILTHSHLDHIQNICQLPRLDFKGKIYATELTSKLTSHITLDGIKIHESNVKLLSKSCKNKHELVPYMSLKTREEALSSIRGYGYDEWISINDHIRFKFISNGHISGSSAVIIEVKDEYEKETIFISGDTSGVRDIPFTKKLDLLDKKYAFTTCILESTYSTNYVPQKSEEEIIEELYGFIKSTCIGKRGKYLIPSFSLSRSTNLFYYLKKTYRKYPELYSIPIYGISPLMKKCHTTIGESSEFYDEKWNEEMDLFEWKAVTLIDDYKDMIRIANESQPSIICSSSGMCAKGMNSFLLPHIVRGKKNRVSFVGYLAEGTEGNKIVDKKQKTISSVIDGKKVTAVVNAKVCNVSGLSSHCSGQEILAELKHTEKKKTRNIILVHGDKNKCENFKELLYGYYDKNKVDIHIPRKNQIIKLT